MSDKKVCIQTFGCQMNVHDSEKMAGILLDEGYTLTEEPKDADIIIFNTCSIREKAEQKFRSELGRTKTLKKKHPGLKIAIAGCMAQQHGKALLKKNPFVNFVFGPQNIQKLKDIIKTEEPVVSIDDNPEIEYTDLPVSRNDKYRSWVSIMYGCNNFCSYCIVPFTRGREKSRPSKNILNEISYLAQNGVKEITLLGQNVNSYKSDIDFPALLKKADSIPGIERIRFVTSHPRDFSDDLIICIKELPKVCEHVHLPLQSGSSRVLKMMNRGYTFKEYMAKIDKLKMADIPGLSITTDIIVGFPSETNDDHAATISALKNIEYDGIFAFNFSPRPGTKAAKMDKNVPDHIKSKRLSQILELQDRITLEKNKALVGTLQEVLVEEASIISKNMSARTRSNKIVNFQGEKQLEGKIINVEILKALKHSLKADIKV